MGHRARICVTKIQPAPSLPSPNAVVPQITVEIRVHWPEHMGHELEAQSMVELAAVEACSRLMYHGNLYPKKGTS